MSAADASSPLLSYGHWRTSLRAVQAPGSMMKLRAVGSVYALTRLCCFLILAALLLVLACRRKEPPAPAPPAGPRFAKTFSLGPFWRGNIHTHTNLSDGDSDPAVVAAWYRDHGYQFLALTDHNLVTDLGLVRAVERADFVVLPGEEVSLWHAGKQVHVNALCTGKTIGGGAFPSAAEAVVWGIQHVRAEGGIALVNHPNFDHALGPADIPAFRGATLLEIFSGHPQVPSLGDATHPSHEDLWDQALGAGLDLMGAAVDDMHHLQACGDPPAYPGRGWVYLSTPALTREELCAALRKGLLVASTGPAVRSVVVTDREYKVEPQDSRIPVTFIARDGRVLSVSGTSYSLKGDEGYVRARLEGPRGTHAWTPAVRVVQE